MNRIFDVEQHIRIYFEKLSGEKKLGTMRQLEELNCESNSLEDGVTIEENTTDRKNVYQRETEWPSFEEPSPSECLPQMDSLMMKCLQKKKLDLSKQLRIKLEELMNAKREERLLQMNVNKEEEDVKIATNYLNSIEEALLDAEEVEKQLQRKLEILSNNSLLKLKQEVHSLAVSQIQFTEDFNYKKEALIAEIKDLNEKDTLLIQQIWMKELHVRNMSNEIESIEKTAEELQQQISEIDENQDKINMKKLQNIKMANKVAIWAEKVKNIVENNL